MEYEIEIVHEPGPADGAHAQHVYTDEQGRRIELGQVQPLAAFHDSGLGLAVRRAKEGPIVIETLDGTYRIFEQDPHNPARMRLALLGDRNGNAVRVHYGADGRIDRIAEKDGPSALVLRYDSVHTQRVERIDYLHHGQLIRTIATYAYSPVGQLAAVRNVAGHIVRRFEYDAGLRLRMHETPSGQRCCYEWQSFTGGPDGEHRPHWRVVRYYSDAGDEARFSYDLAARITRSRDNLGRTTTRHWDEDFHITAFEDEAGAVTKFEWSAPGQLVAVLDAEGGLWRLNYDDWGNISEESDPLGHTVIRDYIGFWGLPKHEIDPDGNTWTYAYDAHGNLSQETNPEGQRTRFVHDVQGRLIQSIDAQGRITRLRWNERSLLTDHIDPHGQRTRFNWDEMGHLSEVIDAHGETTRYQHDPAGYLLKTILPDGREYHYTRDRAGLLTRFANPAGHTTTWTRAVTGDVIERQDPAGQRVRFDYDSHGRLQALTNENGQTYRFAWDNTDRLIAQTDLDGSQQRYHYSAQGHLTQIEHHPGLADRLEDTLNRPGARGDSVTLTPPLLTRFERDATGRLRRKMTSETITDYTYNRSGDVLSICRHLHTPAGTTHLSHAHTLRFDYDKLHRLSAEHSEHGPVRASLRHHYDPLGNLSATTLSDGRILHRRYDRTGHLSTLHLDDLLISDFTRDGLYRETARTQGHLKTLTHYDRTGRVRALSQQLNPDQAGTLPGTALLDKHYDYDYADRLVTHTRQRHGGQPGLGLDRRPCNGRNALPSPERQHYRYDPADRITHRLSANHDLPNETFYYDRAANLLDPKAPAGASQGHIQHNRVRIYEDKRYDWDGFGRLLRKRIGSHTTRHFHYDCEHRLIRVDTASGHGQYSTAFAYDPLGRRIAKTHLRTDSATATPEHTRFHWDGLRLIQEESQFTNSLYLYTDPGSHEPLAKVETDLRPLQALGAEARTGAGLAAAPDLQSIVLRPAANDHAEGGPIFSQPAPLSVVPTASGGTGHWGALTPANCPPLPTRILYFHNALNGAPEEMTDAQGETIWHTTYQVWGNTVREVHEASAVTRQNIRFQGQYLDRETGLHYNTFRYYDPDIGRFTTPDPIGLAGGLNQYQYAPNPIMWIDPWGWACLLRRQRTPTRFISGTTIIDQKTGRTFTGIVDLKPTLDRIRLGGKHPHRNDGSVFQNRNGALPKKGTNYYTEYVHPTPGLSGPGPQRIVVGKAGDMYYTPDHYQTFILIN